MGLPNSCSAPFSARAQCHPLDPSPAGVAYVNSDFCLYKHPFELLRGVLCLDSLAAHHTLSASATGSVHGNEIRSQSDPPNLDYLDSPSLSPT